MPNYLAGKDYTCTVNGTPMAVEDGNYKCAVGEDEVTNLLDSGFYRSIGTTKKATCSLKCLYDGDSPPDFDEDDVIALVIAHPSGPGITGNFRVTNMEYPSITVDAAVRYNFDASSQGAYIKSGGAAP